MSAGRVFIRDNIAETSREVSPTSRVTFALADGTEVVVSLANDGESVEVRNIGSTARFGLAVKPRMSNEVWIEAAR